MITDFDEYKKVKGPELKAEIQAEYEKEAKTKEKVAEKLKRIEEVDKIELRKLHFFVDNEFTKRAALGYFKEIMTNIPIQDIDINVRNVSIWSRNHKAYGNGRINIPDTEMQKIRSIFSEVKDVNLERLGLSFRLGDSKPKNKFDEVKYEGWLMLKYATDPTKLSPFESNVVLAAPMSDALIEAITDKVKSAQEQKENPAENGQEDKTSEKKQSFFGKLVGMFTEEKDEVETKEVE